MKRISAILLTSTLLAVTGITAAVYLTLHRWQIVKSSAFTIRIDHLTGRSWYAGRAPIAGPGTHLYSWLEMPVRNIDRERVDRVRKPWEEDWGMADYSDEELEAIASQSTN